MSSQLHKSGNFKQKNKPFKGSDHYKKSHKIGEAIVIFFYIFKSL